VEGRPAGPHYITCSSNRKPRSSWSDCDFRGVDLIDACAGWTGRHKAFELAHGVGVAFGLDFHSAVGCVLHPALDAVLRCLDKQPDNLRLQKFQLLLTGP